MKLEAVNPLSPENIHVATVTRVKGQYIWLSLEGEIGYWENVCSLEDESTYKLTHVTYVLQHILQQWHVEHEPSVCGSNLSLRKEICHVK